MKKNVENRLAASIGGVQCDIHTRSSAVMSASASSAASRTHARRATSMNRGSLSSNGTPG
ncbi:unannotated protein [freshwater metagenome]|uniref:Unannotated protein n=1 Tax=freshwater metagenome TaxID=449393 RepID=A0A6J5YCM5_9ZZZZ